LGSVKAIGAGAGTLSFELNDSTGAGGFLRLRIRRFVDCNCHHFHRHDADGALFAEYTFEFLIARGALFEVLITEALAARFAEPELHKTPLIRIGSILYW
jgi:hypothetical protein